jgi:hypothetical protein
MVKISDKFIKLGMVGLLALVFVLGLVVSGFNVELFMTSWGLYLSYFLVLTAVAGSILLPLLSSLLLDPKALVRSLLGFGLLAGLFLVSYLISDNVVAPAFQGSGSITITAGISKLVGGLLYLTYILVGLTVLGIFYLEASKLWK